jgi:hypothetical protein
MCFVVFELVSFREVFFECFIVVVGVVVFWIFWGVFFFRRFSGGYLLG